MNEKEGGHKRLPQSPVESAEELYENAPCGYVSFLTDGTIFNINKTLLSWLGYEREEVVGRKKFNSLFKVGGKIFFETHFFPLRRIQGFIKEINFDIVRKDKTTFPGLLNVNEIPGEPNTYRATVFDITDRKIYEQELLEAKKKAENTSEARAQFLAIISHEIRTPLNGIHGIANLLQKTQLTPQQKEYARILLHSSESLLSLVNNLLDLSKIEAQKVKLEQKPFDLAALLEMLISSHKVKAKEKGIQLLTEYSEALPKDLMGDPVKLNQVLSNLLGNAIKFTQKGFVKLQITELGTEKDNVALKFLVSDTGIGIPPEKMQSIFEDFSQASYEVNQNYGGTGLGLSISQKLLQLYGTELQVSSELGKGSEFSFQIKFRLNKEQKTPEPVHNKKTPPSLLNPGNVLIVDDNPNNIFIVSEYLKQWNLSHDASESGEKAISMVKEKQYEIILLDLHMPEMDGYETSRQIRKLDLTTQPIIIALSASGRGKISEKYRKAGINDYVTKPFGPEDLFNALAYHLESFTKYPAQRVPEESLEKNKTALQNEDPQREHPFELSRMVKMAPNNPDLLQKIITNAAKAFQTYLKDYEVAAAERSSEKVRQLLHKSTMTVYYIKASKLTTLLEESAEYFSSIDRSSEEVQKQILKVTAEFEKIIKGLQETDIQDLPGGGN